MGAGAREAQQEAAALQRALNGPGPSRHDADGWLLVRLTGGLAAGLGPARAKAAAWDLGGGLLATEKQRTLGPRAVRAALPVAPVPSRAAFRAGGAPLALGWPRPLHLHLESTGARSSSSLGRTRTAAHGEQQKVESSTLETSRGPVSQVGAALTTSKVEERVPEGREECPRNRTIAHS